MTLAAGSRLGPYEVLALIGAGGMGEVYKARDTRLDRTVAIKVLPAEISSDPDRRARFEQEAKAIAALNHPHICTLHDVGEHAGSTFLVMEHMEGETLAHRLAKGALPVDQALAIAIDIAEALSVAHRHDIIHRDLKPANVMLTRAGAKLLDFGLAKLTGHGEHAVAGTVGSLPTRSRPLTAEGIIVGTLQYMAPEQVEGRPADARTDLWAFGAILYEMLTGKRVFEGASAASLIAAILEHQPVPVASLQPLTPPGVEAVVHRCLAKDPDDRWDTAHDLAETLTSLVRGPGSGSGDAHAPATRRRHRAALIVVAALVVSIIATIALFVFDVRGVREGHSAGVIRLAVPLDPAEYLQDSPSVPDGQALLRTAIALSPDGRALVFAGGGGGEQLYVRRLDDLVASPIAGTEGGANPFFSPDGTWLGFWARGALRKVPIGGGPPVALCPIALPFGASWGADDRIVFATGGGLSQVPASGGQPEPVTTLDVERGEVSHRLPYVLPDGDRILFTVTRSRSPQWDRTQVVLYSRRTKSRIVVVEGGADARYTRTGHIVFVREGTLMASRFDSDGSRDAGGPVGLVPNVMQAAYSQASVYDSGAGQYAISETGTLAYIPGGVVPDPLFSLVLVDRAGHERVLSETPGPFTHPRLAPDGQRLAVATTGRTRDIWIYDLARSVPTARLTTDGVNGTPIWTPDGNRIIYRSGRTGPDNLFWQLADGSGAARRVTASRHNLVPATCAPDGRTILLYDLGEGAAFRGWQLSAVSLGGDAQPRALMDTRFTVSGVDVSPDGAWNAYSSDETGRREVYVQPHGRPGAKVRVSKAGGMSPVWRRDGRELFFVAPQNFETGAPLTVMAVPVTTAPVLSVGEPVALFAGKYSFGTPARHYDVTPDGQHFVMVRAEEMPATRVTRLLLFQNWFEELKAKVPAQ